MTIPVLSVKERMGVVRKYSDNMPGKNCTMQRFFTQSQVYGKFQDFSGFKYYLQYELNGHAGNIRARKQGCVSWNGTGLEIEQDEMKKGQARKPKTSNTEKLTFEEVKLLYKVISFLLDQSVHLNDMFLRES